MAYMLESNAHLFTPQYWDGLAIGEPLQHMPLFSKFVQSEQVEAASEALCNAGDDIVDGWYAEETLPLGKSLEQAQPDGAVVIIDCEKLIRCNKNPYGQDTGAQHRDCRSIEEPFAAYWRTQQTSEAPQPTHFGTEGAYDERTGLAYQRRLEWGVLHTDDEQRRRVGLWHLSHLRATDDGAQLYQAGERVSTKTPDSLDGQVHAYSLPRFDALENPNYTAQTLSIDSLMRVRSVHLITTANGELPSVPAFFAQSDPSKQLVLA